MLPIFTGFINMKLKLAGILSLSIGLVACGGGGGSSDSTKPAIQTKSIEGVAIDGYIKGATVFLDLNYNGKLDDGEPSSITDKEGNYRLALSGSNSDCIDYAPIVVNVPVGAIDADDPENPIQQAYQLVYPPAITVSSDEEIKFTTPLTTILWNEIQEDIHKTGLNSCQALKEAVNTQNKILQNVKDHENRIANRYNITVESLYGDFIKEENKDLYNLAQKMMPALKKSYEETKIIQQKNPDAQLAYVDYYWDFWDYRTNQPVDKWYRTEAIIKANKVVTIDHQVTDDLSNIIKLIRHVESNNSQHNGIGYSKEAWLSFDESLTEYTCSINETIEQLPEQNALTSYGVRNSSTSREGDWDNCSNKSVDSNFYQQLTTITVDGMKEQRTLTQTSFNYNQRVQFDDLVNLSDKINSYSRSDLNILNFLSSSFDENTGNGADDWWRAKYEYLQHSMNDFTQVITEKYSSGVWAKTQYFSNGTNKRECSSDGQTWSVAACKS